MSDPDDRFTQWDPDDLRMPAMDRSGNVHGEAIAMTAVSELHWWGKLWLPVLFWATGRFPALTRTLHGLQFIHFAHWSIVGDKLLFVSNFNGGWEEYIRTFSKRLTRGMRLFWGSSKGFPGPVPVEPFLDYIGKHEYAADVFRSAYPQANTARVERALQKLDSRTNARPNVFTALIPDGLPTLERALDVHDHEFEHMGMHFVRLVDTPDGLLLSAVHDGDKHSFLDRLATPDDKAILLAHEIRPGLFYRAYDATVGEVRQALELLPPDDEEWQGDVPGERLHIDQTLDRLMAKQGKERCQHERELGTVDALLVPRPDRIEAAKHGILEHHGEYLCKVRFSTEGRALGMAIVASDSSTSNEVAKQEEGFSFVLGTGRAFFCRNAEEVSEFQERRAEGGMLRFFLRRGRARGLHNLMMAGRMYPWQRRWRSPLHASYCSLTAFQHGPHVVRWLARPVGEREWVPRVGLREALQYGLRDIDYDPRFEVTFDLCMQVQTDPVKQDVEDARIDWKAPWVPVAWLRIGPQELQDGSGLRARVEKGLGSVNRTRAEIYPALQKKRPV